jgi:hypothetical protein
MWRAGRAPAREDGPNRYARPHPPPAGSPPDLWAYYEREVAAWDERERRYPDPRTLYA